MSADTYTAMPALRIASARVLAGVGGVVLLGSMFLDWYAIDVTAGSARGVEAFLREGVGVDAWRAFAWVDLVLVAAGVAAVALACSGAEGQRSASVTAAAVTALGVAALALIAYRLIDPPVVTGEVFVFSVGVTRELGAWLGAAAAALVTAAGAAALRSRA